jgi:lysylphosphatidylglycerol synthetase-like protein (DUF2156 family)
VEQKMDILTLSLLIVAACLGVFLLTHVFLKKNVSKRIAIAHGLIAGMGLTCLLLYTLKHPAALPYLLLLAGAGLGGLYMFIMHHQRKSVPRFIPLIHGSIGLTGIILLIYYLYRDTQ